MRFGCKDFFSVLAIFMIFSAFQFFENLDEIKNTPKIIYGQSFGGNLAIPLATRNQQKIEGLVVEGTFMNFKNIANSKIPVLGDLIISNNYNNRQNLKNFKNKFNGNPTRR